MLRVHARPHGFGAPRTGGFGWLERPQATEICTQESCDRGATFTTDLYCATHDRFLPFVKNWTNGARVAGIVVVACLVYGCFALAAQAHSWLPLFAVYAAVGLAILALPLRLFAVTVRLTVVLWLVACALALAYRLTNGHVHGVIAGALIMAAACGIAAQSTVFAVGDARDEATFSNPKQRPRGALAFVAGAASLSLTSGLAAAILFLATPTLVAGRSALIVVTAVAAAAFLALALIGSAVAGAIDGFPRPSRDTPEIRRWPGPVQVRWRGQRTAISPRRIRTVIDKMGDVVRRALIRLADGLRIAAVATARITLNILFAAAKIVLNWLIACANFVIKLAIVTARMIAAAAESAIWLLSRAIALVLATLVYVLVTAALPVAAIAAAAGLATVAATQSLRYLTDGSLAALLFFAISAAIATASISIAWIILASQSHTVSWQSAGRTASIAAPYAVLFVAAGGWIVGLPGTFGYGRIHVGWVTIASTTLVAGALLWSQFTGRLQKEESTST